MASVEESKGKQRADSPIGEDDTQVEEEWKAILRTTLRLPAARQPLSVLLFLLDTLAYLRSMTDKSSHRPEDRSDAIKQYQAYLAAMYLSSSTASTTCPPSNNTQSPPFPIGVDVLPALAPLSGVQASAHPVYPEVEKTLQLASVQALRWLQQLKDSQGQPILTQLHSGSARETNKAEQSLSTEDHATEPRDLNTKLDASDAASGSLSNCIDFGSLPSPNKILQATLQRALAESQTSRASTPSTPKRLLIEKASELPIDIGVQRWALSSLLHHYLGDGFGQTKEADGATSYAQDVRDDLAIRELFPDPRRFSVTESDISPSTPSTGSLGRAQEASLSAIVEALKGDDKIKWLLGENVHSQTVRRRSPLPDVPAPAVARNARMVARSPTACHPRRRFMAEQEWLSDAELQETVLNKRRSSSAMSEQLSPPHRRAWSIDSESFDTSSPREWQGGVSLSRISTYDTYNSQSNLLQHRHRMSEASERSLQRGPLSQHADHSQEESAQASHQNAFREAAKGSRPFMDLNPSRLAPGTMQSEPVVSPSANLPPTTNELSAHDKQNLVRKNRKLKAMFGTELEDRPRPGDKVAGVKVQRSEVTDALRSPALAKVHDHESCEVLRHSGRAASAEMTRSSSAPTDYPSQGSTLTRSVSIGSSTYPPGRGNSNTSYQIDKSQLSPIAASFVSSDDGSASSPSAIIDRPPWTQADGAREARRRKLMKIHAFLGERVPPSALFDVAGVVSRPSTNTRGLPMFSKASNRLQRRLTKNKHRGMSLSDREDESRIPPRRHTQSASLQYGSISMDERSRSNSQNSEGNADEARPNAATWTPNSRPAPALVGGDNELPEDPAAGDIGKAAEPVILAVRRARKLEKVFGSLPPAQLYARTNRWLPRSNEDYMPDNLSLRSRASVGSIQRARLASIRFIAESEDPDLVQDFAKVVLSEDSDASDAESRTDVLASFDGDIESTRRESVRASGKPAAAEQTDGNQRYDEELLGAHEDKAVEHRGPSFESLARSSLDTSSSHAPGSRHANDLQTRLALFGTSPNSPPSSMNLFNQRYDKAKSRKGRDSVLSAVTAHSSTGSAYAVDGYGRSQSRASHATSAGAGTSRSSMDSVRIQFKRAHKLATVFGTTRGEVFNRVLDDIEADIAEAGEDEMDEQERKEIIESVAALRASL